MDTSHHVSVHVVNRPPSVHTVNQAFRRVRLNHRAALLIVGLKSLLEHLNVVVTSLLCPGRLTAGRLRSVVSTGPTLTQTDRRGTVI